MNEGWEVLSGDDLRKVIAPKKKTFRKFRNEQARDESHEDEDGLTYVQRQRLVAILRELQRRKMSAIALYEPMELFRAFHQSTARVRLISGSNRSGKTTAGMAEVTYVATNTHPTWKDHQSGDIFLVGRDEKHIADVICAKLFLPGGGNGKMRRIKDEHTGLWRAYRPWQDQERYGESVELPPLIPESLFAGKPSWSDKARGVMEMVKLKTGWTLKLFPGGTSPPQGSTPKFVHLDEEIKNERWFMEVMARLTDFRGRMVWSATPEIGGESLWDIHVRCMEESTKPPGERLFEEFNAKVLDNVHMGDDAKREMEQLLRTDPKLYAAKFLGHYLVESYRVYPNFDTRSHVVDWFPIPDDWCRYVLVDPGIVAMPILFVAVPPPTHPMAGHVFVYEETVLRNTNANEFGRVMKDRIDAQVIEEFIIDWNGSRRTEFTGTTIRMQLEESLVANRVQSLRRGSRFLEGSNDLRSGLMRVREWLMPMADGKPRVLLLRGMATVLENELQKYHYKRAPNGTITNDPEQRGIHSCDALRYGVMHGLPYVKPEDPSRRKSPIRKYLDGKLARRPVDKAIYLGGARRGERNIS